MMKRKGTPVMSNNRRHLQGNQAGMVSIIIATMLILISSLLVLAFAQIARRETRESLDNQLSSQAFYAAESGVNDAKSVINANITGVPAKTQCGAQSPYNANPQLSSGVSYSCLLVDPNPDYLSATADFTPLVVPLASTGTSAINTVTFTWTAPDGAGSLAGCPTSTTSLPKFTAWSCAYGGLRFDLAPTGGALSRASLLAGTMTSFVLPLRSGGSSTLGYKSGGKVQQGSLSGAACTATSCSLTVTGLSAAASNSFSLRLSGLYLNNFNVRVTATDAGGAAVHFKGAQAEVDSTGKAQDVLRRIVVSVPLTSANTLLPAAALQSGDSICKRFSISSAGFSNTTPLPSDAADLTNPLCNPDTSTTYVSQNCIAPHDIVLVLDTSSSMSKIWQDVAGTNNDPSREDELIKVAKTFIQNFGSDLSIDGNHVAVVSFNSNATINQPLSSNQGALISAVNGIQQGGGTNYGKALTSAQTVLSTGRVGVPKVVIFISDGEPDEGDGTAAIEARTTAMKAPPNSDTIYAIGVVDGAPALMQNMASSTDDYTTAQTKTNFEQFFSGISAKINCNS